MNLKMRSILKPVCVTGVAFGSLIFTPEAKAAEQIFLTYQGTEVTISRQDLESFTETGNLPPDLEALIGKDIEVPNAIRTVLAEQLKVPPFVDKFLDSSTGEFLLGQLDNAIGSTESGTQADLESLKYAFNAAAQNDRLSFLEIVRRYPKNSVRVNLSNLEGTYNRVSNFVEKVQPALEVAKGFLQDIICDCSTATIDPNQSSQVNPSATHLYSGQPCNSASKTAAMTEKSSQPTQFTPFANERLDAVERPDATESPVSSIQ